MGVRTLYCPVEDKCALYDSTTEVAFGPIIRPSDGYEGGSLEQTDNFLSCKEMADGFIDYCLTVVGKDPRNIRPKELMQHYDEYITSQPWRDPDPKPESASR